MSDDKNKVQTWLFNPYYYIAGWQALALGLAVILASGCFAFLGKNHFDGLLDFHIGTAAPVSIFLLEGVINWVVFAILLWLGGIMISKSKIRLLDVIGTQSLARFPCLLSAITAWALRPAFERFSLYMVPDPKAAAPLFSLPDAIAFYAMLLVVMLMLLWMVALMYRAFAVSCNVSGGKAAAIFVIAIILGETITKTILLKLVY